jgi:hypothetical protein
MAKAKLDWALFEKAAAAVKQAADFPPDGRQGAIDKRREGWYMGRKTPGDWQKWTPKEISDFNWRGARPSLDSRLDKITAKSDPWFDHYGTHGEADTTNEPDTTGRYDTRRNATGQVISQRLQRSPRGIHRTWLRDLERKARELRQPRLLQGGPSGPSHPGPPRTVLHDAGSTAVGWTGLGPGESISPNLQTKVDALAVDKNRPLPELDGPNTEEPLLPAPHPFNNPNSPSYRPSGPSTALGPNPRR